MSQNSSIYSKYAVSSYLKASGIAPSKSRGQNFLTDENIASNIAAVSLKERSTKAVEIGGGLGSLTEKLIPIYPNDFTVIEYDKALYNHLNARYTDKIRLIHNDVLQTDLVVENVVSKNIDEHTNFDLYGNIPYNIASKILDWLFVGNYNRWNYAVMLVQKDFAERIIAKEGTKDYSALTMFTNFMVNTKFHFDVPNQVFFPVPKVESCVISFTPNDVDKNIFPVYQLISKSLFHNRRKMAKNNLTNSPYLKIESSEVLKMFEDLDIIQNTRGEDISSNKVCQMAYYIFNNNLLAKL